MHNANKYWGDRKKIENRILKRENLEKMNQEILKNYLKKKKKQINE